MNTGKYDIAIRLILLKEFLQANAGRDRVVERRQIEKFLEDNRITVEKKTIYSDLTYLENVLGMQIEYDVHKKGYRLLNAPFEPNELRWMIDGIQSSKFLTAENAKRLTAKIRNLASEEVRKTLNQTSYVADRVRSMNDSVVNDADRIHRAIAEDLKISFHYFHYAPSSSDRRKYSKSGAKYTVSPFALVWNNGNYYLYAYDSEKKKFRYFRVDRMENISNPLPIKRDGKEEYKEKNLTARKAKVFDMYSGTEYTVRMRFRNELADAVVDQFGKDIMLIPCDAEHFTVTAAVEISPPFFAWISTFGRRAKILSPEPVVEKMRDFLKRASEMYNEEG